jgi:hypothetical protein
MQAGIERPSPIMGKQVRVVFSADFPETGLYSLPGPGVECVLEDFAHGFYILKVRNKTCWVPEKYVAAIIIRDEPASPPVGGKEEGKE